MPMDDTQHKAYHRRMMYLVMVLLILLFGGAFMFRFLEKWRLIDALYFSAYTLTTVGYGDFTPHTDAGKLFAIVYMFGGVAIALYGLTLFASHFVEIREEIVMGRLAKIKDSIDTPKELWEKVKNNSPLTKLKGTFKK